MSTVPRETFVAPGMGDPFPRPDAAGCVPVAFHLENLMDEHAMGEWLAAQCKPPEQCRIGVEYEKFLFTRRDHRPLPYAGEGGICVLLEAMRRFGWEPTFEQGHLTGLRQGGATVTLEPAGQFELSGHPWPDLHGVYGELCEHQRQLGQLGREMDFGVMTLGFAPRWGRDQLDWMPKSRYAIMRRYMPRVGVHGLDMMARTCSFQVNFDYCSEQDMRDKFRVAMALQPLVMVALANSPFADGRDSQLCSYRNYVWLNTDSARCGLLPLVFSEQLGFAGYVARALDVPLYSVARDGDYIDVAGRSFRELLAGTLPELPGQKPTLKDWRGHLNSLMYDVRLKGVLELRGSDCLPLAQSMALAAFWTGILYHQPALEKALALIEGCDTASLNQLRYRLPQTGLADSDTVSVAGCYRAASFIRALEYALELAEEGLRGRRKVDAQGADERGYLQPLQEIVANRCSPAEHWRRRFHGRWREAFEPLYRHATF